MHPHTIHLQYCTLHRFWIKSYFLLLGFFALPDLNNSVYLTIYIKQGREKLDSCISRNIIAMQTASSTIWTWITISISNCNNC